jgi:BASS family bile acid:Na+ symporter
LLEQQASLVLPVGKVMQQVVTGLLLPVGFGMLVRRYAPGFAMRNRMRFQRLSMLAVVAMLAIILADQASSIGRNLVSIVVAAFLFTAAAATLGLGVAKALSWTRADTITMVAGFPSRSLGVAALIALNVLGRSDFLSFAATFYLVQALLLAPAMLLSRLVSADA